MTATILNTVNKGEINSTFFEEMGLSTNPASVMFFSCWCSIENRIRGFIGEEEISEIRKIEITKSDAEMQQLKASLHEKIIEQFLSNLANHNELAEMLSEYLNCENVIYDLIQMNPEKSFGCALFIDPTDESLNQLIISDPNSWAEGTNGFSLDYNIVHKNIV